MLEGWIEGAARTDRWREAPENWGRSSKSETRDWLGRGLGRGLGEPLPIKVLKIHTWNHAFWCIVEAKIYIFPSDPGIFRWWTRTKFQVSLHGSVANTTSWLSDEAPATYQRFWYILKQCHFFGVERSPFYKNMYVMVQINPHSKPYAQIGRGGSTVRYHQKYCVGPPILDPRLKQLLWEAL